MIVEYYICGTTREGKILPREHGMTIMCIQQALDAYLRKYSECIHANIDIKLPDPKLLKEHRYPLDRRRHGPS